MNKVCANAHPPPLKLRSYLYLFEIFDFFHWVFDFFSQPKSNFNIVKLYNMTFFKKFILIIRLHFVNLTN